MNNPEDKPLAQAFFLFLASGTGVGLVMRTKEAIASAEVPWTWLWVLWGALFAPAMIVTVVSAAAAGPSWARLKMLYVGHNARCHHSNDAGPTHA